MQRPTAYPARHGVQCLLGKAHTVMAEGGIAAALANVDQRDNWKVHFADPMRGGQDVNNGWRISGLESCVADGVIDAKDLDYEMAQIRKATGQPFVAPTSGTDPNLDVNGAFSTLLTRASADPAVDVRADLSANMNGDLMINKSYLDELVLTILGTQYGDANLDGKVDINDFFVMAGHVNQPGGWVAGDWNGDGMVTFDDFLLLTNHFGFKAPYVPAISGVASSAAAPAPEPASMALLGAGMVLLACRSRRACGGSWLVAGGVSMP